ncbi:hypothetical protein [Rivibacter subsaxonicus]|uniref:DUF3052 family protein n=1 Tax=Rivibacter subsaxonicus TaxID=457575 RepID=A0A4Q7VAR3_9BURK|nr:hypothetical protein [Rivibacter subsaxonicus]RZT93695.1 hypothetical protein EV670_3247 [Rivibacter subsaxonicus]
MTPLFTKLNLGEATRALVLDAPPSFEPEIDALLAARPALKLRRRVPSSPKLDFALAFVTTLAQVEQAAPALVAAGIGDMVLWFAYPKSTSKRYRCEFNRDTGWAALGALGALGFEPVRMVAIDEDWSALRFRRADQIGQMKRDPKRALSATGRAKAGAGRGSSDLTS